MKSMTPALEVPSPERKKTTARELGEALLKWREQTIEKDRQRFIEGVEEARRRMNNEHLH